MALEDLTGAAKFLDDLVITNPVTSDGRFQIADHIRGIKNVWKNTFPNINGAVNASSAELNLLIGGGGDGFTSGTICAFHQASAPTDWTQDTTTSGLAGATLRIETGAGGGAVSGTHDINSPPSWTHAHTDTLVGTAHTLTDAELPSHRHFLFSSSVSSTGSPSLSSSEYVYNENNNTSSTNKKYEMNGNSTLVPDVGRSGETGSGLGHAHPIYGTISSASPSEFAPLHAHFIICEKD